MSGIRPAGSYRFLLDNQRLVRVFALALVGRFGYAVLPLPLLFTIAQATSSFTLAATAVALFGLSASAMPIQARLLDRYGQSRVLPGVGALFTAFLLAAVVMGAMHVASPVAWIAVCVVGGLCAPSLGPSTRAQWREAVDDEHRSAAYSMDAVAEQVLFLLGPAVAAFILHVGPAWPGLGIAALAIPVGVLGLARSPFAPPVRLVAVGGTQRRWVGPMRAAGFRHLLLMMALIGLSTSAVMTALAALANDAGRPALTGAVEVGAGAASVAGGLWWGRRVSTPTRWRADLGMLTALRLPLFAACVVFPHLWCVALCVALSGLTVAPTYAVGFSASDHETEPVHHTEASTWVTTANNLGISVGTALTGWLYVHTTTRVLFCSVGVAVATVLMCALVGSGRSGRASLRYGRFTGAD